MSVKRKLNLFYRHYFLQKEMFFIYKSIKPIITLIINYNLQNKDINNGTLISKIIPWIMATGTILLPEQRLMTGRQTSIELMPATDTGAYFPNKDA